MNNVFIRQFLLPLTLFFVLCGHLLAEVDSEQSQERRIIEVEEWIIPEPDEFFAAVEKSCDADWYKAKRPMLPTNFTDREQTALNIGGLLADAHIAVEAGDAQGASNLAMDLHELCKGLGIGPSVKQRIDELAELAADGNWQKLKLAINQLGEVIAVSLASQQDEDLNLLIRVGKYLRGIEVLSGMIAENYDIKAARLVRQPHLAGYLSGQLDQLPAEVKAKPMQQELVATLNALREIMNSSEGYVPSNDAVVKLHNMATEFNARIADSE